MDSVENKLTELQAFYAMRLFLEKYYEETGSDDVGSLLSELQFFEREKETADPAAWGEWMECINKVVSEKDKNFEVENSENSNLSDIKNIPSFEGKVGTLADGRIVNVRNVSTDGRPTLEIYDPETQERIKIRYGDKPGTL